MTSKKHKMNEMFNYRNKKLSKKKDIFERHKTQDNYSNEKN